MNSRKVLELVDDLIFAKTGKHLDDLQKNVLKGIIEGDGGISIFAQFFRFHISFEFKSVPLGLYS